MNVIKDLEGLGRDFCKQAYHHVCKVQVLLESQSSLVLESGGMGCMANGSDHMERKSTLLVCFGMSG